MQRTVADTYESQSTLDRIKATQIRNVASDTELVATADVILSIVPPRDAVATARRVVESCKSSQKKDRTSPLTYVDLNAISPRTAKVIAAMVTAEASPAAARRRTSFSFKQPEPKTQPIPINFLDGGIIGGPPTRRPDTTWKRPSIVVSGSHHLDPELASVLNLKHLSEHIGPASALRSCFAALSKGFTALSILSFTTASACGVLPELQSHLEEFNPIMKPVAEGGLIAMPPKAYRWVDEMVQISETLADEGGFGEGHGGKAVFEGVSEIYKLVADSTELGREKTESRKRGRTVEDATKCIQEGMRKKRRGSAEGNQDLSVTWRGSWS
jgi:hypothetical protein